MKIYIITKPGTNEVYIGQTKSSLKRRLQYHFSEQKRKLHREVYKWLDETCTIELLEEFNSNKPDLIKEMSYLQEYISNGFCIKNTRIGKYTLNPEVYIKDLYDKHNAKYKANGKRKEWNDKHNAKNKAKMIANRHPDYVNWQNKIVRLAKKESLTSKEYRFKYNIPDYTGPKTIN